VNCPRSSALQPRLLQNAGDVVFLCLLHAAVFDGHGGCAAARYLNERLYQVYSDAVDDNMLNSMDADSCDADGAVTRCLFNSRTSVKCNDEHS
jgi:serine/threonine protein phosphatase PrpC